MIIDFHTHIYPSVPFSELVSDQRRKLRSLLKTQVRIQHWAQTKIRTLPESLQRSIEEVATVSLAPRLLIESDKSDHREAMDESLVDRAVVVAHPPLITNDFLLQCTEAEDDLIPAVYIKPGDSPATELEKYFERGVRILKLHPITDGMTTESKHYREQLEFAEKKGMIVIIHSGVIHSKLMFKRPDYGDISKLASGFEKYPNVNFVVAHMNFHFPDSALKVAREFPNVYLTTSWQPTEVIAKAAKDLGDERLLFSSDWPLLGDNMAVATSRIREGSQLSLYSRETEKKILGGNAAKLLKKYDL